MKDADTFQKSSGERKEQESHEYKYIVYVVKDRCLCVYFLLKVIIWTESKKFNTNAWAGE